MGFDDAEVKCVDEIDWLRMTLKDERIIHLSPSGNASELLCYAEADDFLVAHECVKNSLNNIQKL